ncbi:hypothetical protein M3J09_009060 [Ascochyta lentis]
MHILTPSVHRDVERLIDRTATSRCMNLAIPFTSLQRCKMSFNC